GSLSCQPLRSNCSPPPDATRWTRTKAHDPPTLADFDLLKLAASVVRRSSFSGEEATSMAVQPPGTFSVPPVVPPELDLPSDGHAAVRSTDSTRTTNVHRFLIGPRPTPTAG